MIKLREYLFECFFQVFEINKKPYRAKLFSFYLYFNHPVVSVEIFTGTLIISQKVSRGKVGLNREFKHF